MGCSNFCSSNDFKQISANIKYIPNAKEREEYHRMQKAYAIYETQVEASTKGAGRGLEEASHLIGGDITVTGPIALLVGCEIVKTLFAAVSTTIKAKRASDM